MLWSTHETSRMAVGLTVTPWLSSHWPVSISRYSIVHACGSTKKVPDLTDSAVARVNVVADDLVCASQRCCSESLSAFCCSRVALA